MKKILALFAALLVITSTLAGQAVPPSAGELTYRLLSPVYMGSGLQITRTDVPEGVMINPASAAGFQRVILDVNYTYMHGFGTDATGSGNAANLAMSIPTRIGVVSWGLGFQETLQYAGTPMDLGISSLAYVAFSKEIYSDLWFGFGLDGGFGKVDGGPGAYDVCMLQREMAEVTEGTCETIYPPPGYLHDDEPDPGVLKQADPLKVKK